MSASGKSSNRNHEYWRAYFVGGGNGPAALQGETDRKKDEDRISKAWDVVATEDELAEAGDNHG